MKTFTVSLIMLMCISLFQPLMAQTSEETVKEFDKTFLMEYLTQNIDAVEAALNGVRNKQLNFQPGEEKWSVGNCIEHIIKTEGALLSMLKKGMEVDANNDEKETISITDEEIINGVTDRSAKAKAPSMLQPTKAYPNSSTALKEFLDQRKQLLSFITSHTEEELRNHVIKNFPVGTVDAFQACLMIIAHANRHLQQIKEVKANKAYQNL